MYISICPLFILISFTIAQEPINPLSIFHIAKPDGSNCTAVVVNEEYLLTAASCIMQPIIVYANNYDRYDVKEIKKHPEYNPKSDKNGIKANDLALIQLNKALPSGSYKILDNENLREVIFGSYGEQCQVLYWHSEIDSFHKALNSIPINYMQFR